MRNPCNPRYLQLITGEESLQKADNILSNETLIRVLDLSIQV